MVNHAQKSLSVTFDTLSSLFWVLQPWLTNPSNILPKRRQLPKISFKIMIGYYFVRFLVLPLWIHSKKDFCSFMSLILWKCCMFFTNGYFEGLKLSLIVQSVLVSMQVSQMRNQMQVSLWVNQSAYQMPFLDLNSKCDTYVKLSLFFSSVTSHKQKFPLEVRVK